MMKSHLYFASFWAFALVGFLVCVLTFVILISAGAFNLPNSSTASVGNRPLFLMIGGSIVLTIVTQSISIAIAAMYTAFTSKNGRRLTARAVGVLIFVSTLASLFEQSLFLMGNDVNLPAHNLFFRNFVVQIPMILSMFLWSFAVTNVSRTAKDSS